eukprot:3891719-Prymnesium_polylepis.4
MSAKPAVEYDAPSLGAPLWLSGGSRRGWKAEGHFGELNWQRGGVGVQRFRGIACPSERVGKVESGLVIVTGALHGCQCSAVQCDRLLESTCPVECVREAQLEGAMRGSSPECGARVKHCLRVRTATAQKARHVVARGGAVAGDCGSARSTSQGFCFVDSRRSLQQGSEPVRSRAANVACGRERDGPPEALLRER